MSIAQNKKAFHDYFIEEKYEAGIVLEGWEVKAIRENRIQLKEAYVIIQRGEIYLIAATSRRWVLPLPTSGLMPFARVSCCCTMNKSPSS